MKSYTLSLLALLFVALIPNSAIAATGQITITNSTQSPINFNLYMNVDYGKNPHCEGQIIQKTIGQQGQLTLPVQANCTYDFTTTFCEGGIDQTITVGNYLITAGSSGTQNFECKMKRE